MLLWKWLPHFIQEATEAQRIYRDQGHRDDKGEGQGKRQIFQTPAPPVGMVIFHSRFGVEPLFLSATREGGGLLCGFVHSALGSWPGYFSQALCPTSHHPHQPPAFPPCKEEQGTHTAKGSACRAGN